MQRLLVFCAEQAGHGDDDLTLDLRCLGVLGLPSERDRQVGGRDERLLVISAENAAPLIEHFSAESLRFCELFQAV